MLPDLMRYRTQNHEHTEDFVSSVLAVLLNRDPDVRRAVMSLFKGGGWNVPKEQSSMQVRTQVRALHGDTVLIPDLVVDCGQWNAVIECKIKAPPSDSQLSAYRNLGPDQVALLAPERELGKASNDWPKASWQQVWCELQGLAPGRDPVANWMREQLSDLLRREGLSGAWDMPRHQLMQGAFSNEALRPYTRAVKEALLALYSVDDAAEIEVNGALDMDWSRDDVPDTHVITSLGLSGERPEGTHGQAFEWTLWVRMASSHANRLDAAVSGDRGWESAEDDWFYLELADSLTPTRGFVASLQMATERAAEVLRRLVDEAELGRVGCWTAAAEEHDAFSPGAYAIHATTVDTALRTLRAWHEKTLDTLNAKLSELEVGVTRHRTYRTVHRDGRAHLWLSASSKLHVHKARLSVDLGWEGKTAFAAEADAVRRELRSRGLEVKRKDRKLRVDASLLEFGLQGASDRLADGVAQAIGTLLAGKAPA